MSQEHKKSGFSDRPKSRLSDALRHLDSSAHVCDWWLKQLHQKRYATIAEAATQAVTDLGERLYVGGYDKRDPFAVALALGEYSRYLVGGSRDFYGQTLQWRGPYIRPLLGAMDLRPDGFIYTQEQFLLLCRCGREKDDAILHGITADAVEELGHTEWAAYLRELPAIRRAYQQWVDSPTRTVDAPEKFNAICWRFTMNWDRRHRDVPRLLNFGR